MSQLVVTIGPVRVMGAGVLVMMCVEEVFNCLEPQNVCVVTFTNVLSKNMAHFCSLENYVTNYSVIEWSSSISMDSHFNLLLLQTKNSMRRASTINTDNMDNFLIGKPSCKYYHDFIP